MRCEHGWDKPEYCVKCLTQKLDLAQEEISRLKAQESVRSGEWCLGNVAAGRNPCGICPRCCRNAYDRAEKAELQVTNLREKILKTVEYIHLHERHFIEEPKNCDKAVCKRLIEWASVMT